MELCQRGDRTIGHVTKDFDLTETAVRDWVKQAELDAGTRSDRLSRDERVELAQLRRENRRLREDVEILKRTLWPGSYEVTTPRPMSARAPPDRGRQILLRTRSQSVDGSDPAGGAHKHHLCQSVAAGVVGTPGCGLCGGTTRRSGAPATRMSSSSFVVAGP